MVSRRPLPPSTRDRLLDAAAAEFAARGFDGAKVDRIALRYYHFRSKAGLYREILRRLFQSIADAVAGVLRDGGPPDLQVRRFVRVIAGEAIAQPHFPAIWLREMADGGRHLDEPTIRAIGAVVGGLAAVLRRGHQTGTLRDVHPLAVHLGIVAPLLLFAASEPVRARFEGVVPGPAMRVTRQAVLDHVEAATLAVITPAPHVRKTAPRRATPPSRSTRS
jgi:AcrR family transcriptional regulator